MNDFAPQFGTSELAWMIRDLMREQEEKEAFQEQEAIGAAMMGQVVTGPKSDAVLGMEQTVYDHKQTEQAIDKGFAEVDATDDCGAYRSTSRQFNFGV